VIAGSAGTTPSTSPCRECASAGWLLGADLVPVDPGSVAVEVDQVVVGHTAVSRGPEPEAGLGEGGPDAIAGPPERALERLAQYVAAEDDGFVVSLD
jgi:hypothetical protein